MKVNQELVQPSQIGEADNCEPFEYDQAYIDWSEKLMAESELQLDAEMQSNEPSF